MTQLFRTEALDHRRFRLFGDVVIASHRSDTWLVVAIGALALGMLLWATSGHYSRTETAPGSVVMTRPATKVTAQKPGVVTQLLVSEGQIVAAGQALVTVTSDSQIDDNHAAGADGLASLERQLILVRSQGAILDQASRQEEARLSDQIASTRREQVDLQEQARLQGQIAASSETILERLQTVADKGYVSKFELERHRQNHLRERQQLTQISQQRTAAEARLNELEAQSRQLPTSRAKQTADLQASVEALEQQRAVARGQAGYVVTAPVAGRISALNVATGRYVDPRMPLLVVLPQGGRFEAELYAPSRAIGFVKPGQTVRLMYDAFPYRQFGSFKGTVIGVTQSITAPGEIDVPTRLEEATYRIRVRLEDQAIAVKGSRIPLQSGMALKANVVLERRSFFDWLLEPVRAVRNRS
jgi:membrane fusion protein